MVLRPGTSTTVPHAPELLPLLVPTWYSCLCELRRVPQDSTDAEEPIETWTSLLLYHMWVGTNTVPIGRPYHQKGLESDPLTPM